jgi:hypothetical protein
MPGSVRDAEVPGSNPGELSQSTRLKAHYLDFPATVPYRQIPLFSIVPRHFRANSLGGEVPTN